MVYIVHSIHPDILVYIDFSSPHDHKGMVLVMQPVCLVCRYVQI
jgi:hypothetical protein